MTFSSNTIEQLEFQKIRDKVLSYVKGASGRKAINEQPFFNSLQRIQRELDIITDIVKMIQEGELFDLYPYEDVSQDVFYLGKNGYVLEIDSLQRIVSVLNNYKTYKTYFNKDRIKNYPEVLKEGYVEGYTENPIKEIYRVLDEEGNVRDNASPELVRINNRINGIKRSVDKEFDQLILRYKKQNLLSDTEESIRQGRRVLVLPVEHKRKINGIIHDQSATGKTVYIEPTDLSVMNNEILSLENDRRAEIYKILRKLSEILHEHTPMISDCFDVIVRLDVLRSKGQFSFHIEGQAPNLVKNPVLHLKDARHPILLLKELKGGDPTISFDLHLRNDNRMLLISGPNAGGKSVTLKAIGLLHLMTYFGLMIPAHEESEIAIFNQVFTDVGDQQSIDEGLSTYSSHLSNLTRIVNQADKRTLVLLDEIGSGTDPKLGGAIAEGIIKELLRKKCQGVITTHYSELKVFAFRNKGIINGAMLFDKENLQPTYRLKAGKPGSSYAFEVAKKVGLNEKIVQYARKKVGKKENQIEDLLVDLQEGKAIIEEQLEWIKQERKQLDKLIKNYDSLSKEFQVKRKKLQIRAKEVEQESQRRKRGSAKVDIQARKREKP